MINRGDETAPPAVDEEGKPLTSAIRRGPDPLYTGVEAWVGESAPAPLLAQLRALGFSDRQLRTLSRLSVETQEEVYLAVMTLMLSDNPVLDDFLGTV